MLIFVDLPRPVELPLVGLSLRLPMTVLVCWEQVDSCVGSIGMHAGFESRRAGGDLEHEKTAMCEHDETAALNHAAGMSLLTTNLLQLGWHATRGRAASSRRQRC